MNSRMFYFLLIVLFLAGCVQISSGIDGDNSDDEYERPRPTLFETTVPQPKPPLPYGLVYPLAESKWSEADREDVRTQLAIMNERHVNTVVQIFSSRLIGTGNEAGWLIFLDEAERAEIQVIARLWPLPEWDGDVPDLAMESAFLEVVSEHPAFLAYLGLHEPLERYDSEQMRTFYTGMKEIAPDVPLAHYMGNMALFDGSLRFLGRYFTDGICDLCIVWCTPAQTQNGEPYFDETAVFDTVHDNRLLIDERAPESELWFLGQTYALQAHRHQLRMPTPDEMAQIFSMALDEGVDGFLWYPWLHGNYDLVLSSSEMEAQQQAVHQIYEDYLVAR